MYNESLNLLYAYVIPVTRASTRDSARVYRGKELRVAHYALVYRRARLWLAKPRARSINYQIGGEIGANAVKFD